MICCDIFAGGIAVSRLFTHAEAEALLPQIVPILHQIRAAWDEVVESGYAVAVMRQRIIGNGHGLVPEMRAIAQRFEHSRTAAEQLITEVKKFGIELKDPRLGLIDFPSARGGRTVYLCWKLGEDHIEWWHEIDSGYANRQPLEY